jgi:hypothetical protein
MRTIDREISSTTAPTLFGAPRVIDVLRATRNRRTAREGGDSTGLT